MNTINNILLNRIKYEKLNGKFPTHLMLQEKFRQDFKSYVTDAQAAFHKNYYDETDEMNHRLESMKVGFCDIDEDYVLYTNPETDLQQKFVDDLKASYTKNAEDYRDAVDSDNRAKLKDVKIEMSGIEIYEFMSFLSSSRKLFDEGRLPHRSFEDGAHNLESILRTKLKSIADIKSAPGLDYHIFESVCETDHRKIADAKIKKYFKDNQQVVYDDSHDDCAVVFIKGKCHLFNYNEYESSYDYIITEIQNLLEEDK